MPTITVRIRGSARAKIAKLKDALRGHKGQKVLRAIGQAMLTEIHKAFLVKSAGGTDEAGDRWADLAKFTVSEKKRGKYAKNATAILMESGELANSLKPPQGSGRRKSQVFSVANGQLVLGTEREWSWTHQKGIAPWLPERRLWPPPRQWPASWWKRINEAAKMALIEVITDLLKAK